MDSLIIDAWERRDVATIDVGGAFLLAKIMEFVLIRMEGEEVEVMKAREPIVGGGTTRKGTGRGTARKMQLKQNP